MDVNKIQGVVDPPYIRFLFILTFFILGVYILKAQLQIQEISRNWPKYRCKPQVMPFASLYGHDTVENFNYCMTNIFNEQSGQTVGPFFKILATFGTVLGTLLGTINNLRLQGASLYGGITQIFTEFSTRMAQLILKINTSFIRIKQLMFRIQTTMFAIMYMGLSGVNAVTSFGDTALFSFLDFFCFPPDTPIEVYNSDTHILEHIPIGDIRIGHKMANGKQITSKFEFDVAGQPMVLLGDRVLVSANHYVRYDALGTFVMAKDHPDSVEAAPYTGKLICLNCEDNQFELGGYTFLDFDETPAGDQETMSWVEKRLNGLTAVAGPRGYNYDTAVAGSTAVLTHSGKHVPIAEIELGAKLQTGSVIGKVQKVVREVCVTEKGTEFTPANLLWDEPSHSWVRAGDKYPIQKLAYPRIFYSLVVTGATIALASGEHIRDYLEIHSPDSEQFYSAAIKQGECYGLSRQ